ncbi:MAG: glutaredoxin family protein [Desulfatiglans sp.]|jgi:glutaredoxin-like protein NrdH|nr:glutaredoxin family protein [Thermodesulfobacteriota bacterium]MEE4352215.1 glutaredoxin family protein [Desulfatiglans sp.]
MGQDIIVYSTPLCAPCESLKRYLKEKGVEFTVKDLLMDEEAAEYLADKNIRSTPVLQVDDELVVGFQKEKVDELLGF